MEKRPPKHPTIPWLSPYLTVRDVAAAVDFYTRAFGFETKRITNGSDGKPIQAELVWRDALVLIGGESAKNPDRSPNTLGARTATYYVYVDDVDALHERATGAGARALFPPREEYWGDRVCLLHDLDGHAWLFATNVADPKPAP